MSEGSRSGWKDCWVRRMVCEGGGDGGGGGGGGGEVVGYSRKEWKKGKSKIVKG